MGTVRHRGIAFRVYPKDHDESPTPHVHARFDAGEVRIALLPNEQVALSEEHMPAVAGRVKRNEVRKALEAAAEMYDELAREWGRMHP
ncbi:MAG TPA: DUF4160 domain-containing protein [Candidatus Elarobacter sp.]